WNLSSDLIDEVIIPIDTAFSLFNRYRLADRYSPFNAYLGSYGLPFYQINFFDRPDEPDEFLYYYYYPLLFKPENFVFMNTQVPFTQADWTFGGPRETAEQTFRVRHSRNVNRFLNFGLIYDIIYNLGQYSSQRAIDKDFTFYGSYTGERYKAYFATGINNIFTNENGGIKDKSQLATYSTTDVEVNLGSLNNAQSVLKNRNFLIVQRYTIGGASGTPSDSAASQKSKTFRLSGTFSHIFDLDLNTRTYSDSYPLSGFYDSIYISKVATFDSLYSRSIKNTIRFDFATDASRKFRLGGGVGIRNELFKYSQIVPTHDTLGADTAEWHRSNNVLIGRLFNNIGTRFGWVATGEMFLTGYRAGDFTLNGVITKTFDLKKGKAVWDITGGIMNRQPSFWYEQWGSNNFEWHNNFKKTFRVDVGTKFSYPVRNAVLRFNYAIINNYTDFDTLALPAQYSGGLSVASIYAQKDLRAWKLHLNTEVLVQKSSNPAILDLPLAAVRVAGYFQHMFNFRKTNGQLNTQIGIDVTYHTLYHAYSYMPATGRFYRQDTELIGDYPFVNAFLNIKLKRTRIFLEMDHINWSFSGYNYFMVPSYPMNARMFRFGLSWTFYD
ncbi:MAG: putative porin, partial [Bacteroidales bacterium]